VLLEAPEGELPLAEGLERDLVVRAGGVSRSRPSMIRANNARPASQMAILNP